MTEPVTEMAATPAAHRRFLRELAELMHFRGGLARILRSREVTREKELEWSKFVAWPEGDRADIYAVAEDDGYARYRIRYFDVAHNELDVMWVLSQLRETAAPSPMSEQEALQHPWMQERAQ